MTPTTEPTRCPRCAWPMPRRTPGLHNSPQCSRRCDLEMERLRLHPAALAATMEADATRLRHEADERHDRAEYLDIAASALRTMLSPLTSNTARP